MLPSFNGSTKAVVQGLALDRIGIIECVLIAGRGDNAVGIIITKTGLALRYEIVRRANHLREPVQQVVVIEARNDAVGVLAVDWPAGVVIKLSISCVAHAIVNQRQQV